MATTTARAGQSQARSQGPPLGLPCVCKVLRTDAILQCAQESQQGAGSEMEHHKFAGFISANGQVGFHHGWQFGDLVFWTETFWLRSEMKRYLFMQVIGPIFLHHLFY